MRRKRRQPDGTAGDRPALPLSVAACPFSSLLRAFLCGLSPSSRHAAGQRFRHPGQTILDRPFDGDDAMRGLFGFLVGIGLTIGGTYLYDTMNQQPGIDGSMTERPLVNWDVVSQKWGFVTDRARREWNRFAG